ncbi:MAG TPA: hypothetical protein VF841_17130 [Anaeromyxobacter sp.]
MGLLSARAAGAILGAALAAVLPAAAGAEGPAFGLRLGWATSLGDAADHLPLSEEVAWLAPVQADALWTFAPSGRIAAGAYASWGPGRGGTAACADGAACSAQAIRAGAQGLWTFYRWRPGSGAWVGAGAGWEWTSVRRERLGAATTTRWNGPELSIQGGAAWRLGEAFAIGPFAQLGVGRYAGVTVETPVETASAPIADRRVHAWAELGVRATFDVEL